MYDPVDCSSVGWFSYVSDGFVWGLSSCAERLFILGDKADLIWLIGYGTLILALLGSLATHLDSDCFAEVNVENDRAEEGSDEG